MVEGAALFHPTVCGHVLSGHDLYTSNNEAVGRKSGSAFRQRLHYADECLRGNTLPAYLADVLGCNSRRARL